MHLLNDTLLNHIWSMEKFFFTYFWLLFGTKIDFGRRRSLVWTVFVFNDVLTESETQRLICGYDVITTSLWGWHFGVLVRKHII